MKKQILIIFSLPLLTGCLSTAGDSFTEPYVSNSYNPSGSGTGSFSPREPFTYLGSWLLGSKVPSRYTSRLITTSAATDSRSGELVIGGFFEGVVNLGNSAVPPNGVKVEGTLDATSPRGYGPLLAFVARYWPNGALKWVRRFGAATIKWGSTEMSASAGIEALAIDSQGNALASGFFEGQFALGSLRVLRSQITRAPFLLKFSANGDPLWIRWAENARGIGRGVAVLPQDRILWTADLMNSSPSLPLEFTLTDQNAQDTLNLICHDCVCNSPDICRQRPVQGVLLTEFSSEGRTQWAEVFGGNGVTSAAAVAGNSSGEVFVVGRFEGDLHIHSQTLNNAGPLGTYDYFIVKYFRDQTRCGWTSLAKSFGGMGDERAPNLTVDSQNNIYVSGIYSSETPFEIQGFNVKNKMAVESASFVVKMDSNLLAMNLLSSTSLIYGIAADRLSGNLYFTGSGFHIGSACNQTFGPNCLIPRGPFVAKFSSNFDCDSIRYAGQYYSSFGRAVTLGPDGSAWIVGGLGQSLNFNLPEYFEGQTSEELNRAPEWIHSLNSPGFASFLLQVAK